MLDWEPEILRRLAPLELTPTRESEIAEELAQHLDDRYQELIASGQSQDSAFRTALDELEGEDLLVRSLRRLERNFDREPIAPGKDAGNFFSGILQDVRFAFRILRKTPLITGVALLSLALGIGANTAIFSLIDAVMLRMLPVSHPEQLMFVNTNSVQSGSVRVSRNISNAALKQMQDRAKSVTGVAATEDHAGKLNVQVNGQSELTSGNFVSGNYCSLLGVPAILGRTIGVDEDRPDGRVALLSFTYWQ